MQLKHSCLDFGHKVSMLIFTAQMMFRQVYDEAETWLFRQTVMLDQITSTYSAVEVILYIYPGRGISKRNSSISRQPSYSQKDRITSLGLQTVSKNEFVLD